MTFLDANPKKLEFLLTHGMHEGELKKFFTESRMQLLLNHARVQNMPHGREQRVRAICEKLPPKTDHVLRGWFQKNVSVAAPVSLDEAVMYLEAYFDSNEPIPETERQVVCRSALMYLFGEMPDEELAHLLLRPLGIASTDKSVVSSALGEQDGEPIVELNTPTDADSSVDGSAPQNYQLAELLASVITGDENAIDNALAPFAESTRTLVEGLLLLRDGRVEDARKLLPLLHPDGPELELVRSALARARHIRTTNAPLAGIRPVIPEALDKYPDASTYEIVAIHTNESATGAVFVQPLFLILGGQLRQLSEENRIRLFPDSGDVMTHKSMLRRQLTRGELVHWSVLERDVSGGKTRYHLEAELNPLIEVVRIPVPSSDPDEVRDRIKAYANTGRTQPGQQVMFLLGDGVVVASSKDVDFARDEAFDQPWQAWVSLQTWLIEGRQYCIGVSQQDAESVLDLSPLDAAFRRLLKSLHNEQKLTITKAQRREIAGLLRSFSGEEFAQRAQRIAASIDQISINEDELEVVLSLLRSRAEVRRRVDELISKELDEHQSEKAALQGEITALKRKKAELEKEGQGIERSNQNRANSAASSVQVAFRKAIEDGATTLANAEIVQLLAGAVGSALPQGAPAAASGHSSSWIKRGVLSATAVKTRLAALGINGRRAIILAALSDLAAQSGAALILKGGFARQCAQTLVRQGRETVGIIDIPMGLTCGDFLRHPLENLAEVQGLAVLNANLSPFEVYGTELLDLLMDQVMSEVPSFRPILLSCLAGGLSLPLPEALRRVSLVVDLDSNWDEGEQRLEDVEPKELLLLSAIQERMQKALSAVEDNIRQHVERALVKASLE